MLLLLQNDGFCWSRRINYKSRVHFENRKETYRFKWCGSKVRLKQFLDFSKNFQRFLEINELKDFRSFYSVDFKYSSTDPHGDIYAKTIFAKRWSLQQTVRVRAYRCADCSAVKMLELSGQNQLATSAFPKLWFKSIRTASISAKAVSNGSRTTGLRPCSVLVKWIRNNFPTIQSKLEGRVW